jgi:hypothetical protein
MMSCETFRSQFRAGNEEPAVLEHIRTCDRCLDFAASVDPDVMFRALGGEELIPAGGVDAFVGEVMQQVRVRSAETRMGEVHVISWPRRVAVAATLVAGVTGAMLFNRWDAPSGPGVQTPAAIHARAHSSVVLATKPIIETYESEKATFVDVPSEEAGDDVKIVMIFDENLPADL